MVDRLAHLQAKTPEEGDLVLNQELIKQLDAAVAARSWSDTSQQIASVLQAMTVAMKLAKIGGIPYMDLAEEGVAFGQRWLESGSSALDARYFESIQDWVERVKLQLEGGDTDEDNNSD